MEAEQARLRAALAALEPALLRLDPEGEILEVNPAARRLLGELAGRPLSDLCDGASALLACAAGAGFAVGELRRDGGAPLAMRLVPIQGGRGYMAALSSEQSQPPATQEPAAVQAWAPVMQLTLDLAGHLTRVTARICQWSGLREEELLGRHFTEFLHPEERAAALAAHARLLAGEQSLAQAERRYLGAGGRLVWAEVSAAVMHADGHAVGIIAYLRDITDQKLAEAEARRELARFRAIFEQNPAGTILYEPASGRLQWNPAALEMFGYPAGTPCEMELAAMSRGLRLLTAEGEPLAPEAWPIEAALRGETVKELELRVTRDDSPFVREIRASAVPVRDPRGEVMCLLMVTADLTAAREAERALARSELRLKALLDSLPIPVVMVHDREARRMTVNACHAENLGLTTETNIAVSANAGARPGYDVKVNGVSLPQYDSPPVVAAREGRVTEPAEHELVGPDGSSRFLYGRGVPVRDGGGELVGAFAIFVDITERKLAEEALKASEARARRRAEELCALLDALPATVLIAHDSGCERVTGNLTTYRLLGAEPGSNLSLLSCAREGRPLPYLAAPREGGGDENLPLRRAARGESVTGSETEVLLPSGELRWFSGNAVPLYDESGALRGAIAAFVDITDRREAEQALKASEAQIRAQALELNALLEAIPAAVLIARDRACAGVSGNPSAYALLGLPPGGNLSRPQPQGEGAPPFEYLQGGEPVPPAALPLERAAQGERLENQEIAVRLAATGELRHLFGNAVPLLDEQGAPRGAVAAFVNVTALREAQAALAARSAELEALLAALPAVVFIAHDRDACLITGNPEAHRLLRVPLGENISKTPPPGGPALPFEVLLEGRPVEPAQLPVQRAARGEETPLQELEVRFPDGGVSFIAGRAVPILDAAGAPRGAVAAFVDISARRQAEEALRASEARERRQAAEFQALLAAIPALVYVAHDPECRTITGSRATHELLRVPPGAGLSLESPSGEGAAGGFSLLREGLPLAADQLPLRRAARGELVMADEHTIVFPDGETRHFSGNAVPLRDEQGRITGAISAFVDITARREAERALKLSEMRERARAAELAAVFEHAPAPLFIALDPECRVVKANRSAKALFGMESWENFSFNPPEGEPLPPTRLFQDGLPLLPEEIPMQRAIRRRAPVQAGVVEVVRPDGSSRYMSGRAVPLIDDGGEVRGALGAFLDITEQVSSQQALERQNQTLERINAELEEFAYAASHDLKAPLRAVAQLADWLTEELEHGLDQGNRERLRLLRSRVVRMDNLINGLLAYARLGDHSPGGPEALALAPVVQEVAAELELPHSFTLTIEGELPTLEADRLHLRQLMQNLIGNAVKHHDRPAGTITLRAAAEGPFWRIEVADDGPGIPEPQREHVFKMFATLRRRDETEHTGIGLALVRKLASRYGGEVTIEENQPRGTVVVVRWPKRVVQQAPRLEWPG